ncbi:hypothetical protein DPMD02_10 [Desulfofustis phage LS06-2018-MD02]|nr:hypothetical protein DPMD02_10 [Desulfofustis phage LS06-2018-MD02]
MPIEPEDFRGKPLYYGGRPGLASNIRWAC